MCAYRRTAGWSGQLGGHQPAESGRCGSRAGYRAIADAQDTGCFAGSGGPAQPETKPDAQPESEAVPASDVQAVDVNSLELLRPRSVGVEQIGLWAMRQVEFSELLCELGLSCPIRAAILGVIIGRMAAPGSELAAHRWLGQQSVLDVDFERMPLMTLYRASDALMKYRDSIERTLRLGDSRWLCRSWRNCRTCRRAGGSGRSRTGGASDSLAWDLIPIQSAIPVGIR